MKRIVSIVIILGLPLFVEAQQLFKNSQYMLDHYFINPAVAGSTEDIPVSFTYRKLWAGMKESPSIQSMGAHMQILPRMGVGAKLFNYSMGPIKRTGFEASYAYHIPVTQEGAKLSFGLSGLLYQYSLNKNSLSVEQEGDLVLMGAENMLVPDVVFGMYFYDPKFYVGLAIPQLLERRIDLKTKRYLEQKQVRHYFLHSGYKYQLDEQWLIEPSVLVKFIEAGILQTDINIRTEYKQMLSGGLSYRTGEAIVFQLGYKKDKFFVGYAYDVLLSDIRSQSFGSHEIMFLYSFDNFLSK